MAERVCCSYQNVLSIQNRVCCLYRVSTTKQVDHDDQNQADIPVQRKACREFAERMGWTIVYEEQENGVSGFKVSANDRDKIQLIKEYAEQGKFDILLVFMFDRIGRRAEETPFVVEWLINHGIQVWSVNEGEQRIDTHVDRLTNYIRFWQADGESQKTSMRTKAALGQMVQEGRFRGGSAPYGYDLVPSGTYNKRKHEVFKLEINPDEAKVVRMMFDLCVGSGYGRFKIANFLSEMGIKTRDGKNWHEATVGHILHNIMYTGVLRSGSTQSKAFPDLQIISPENFELAQKLMAERANECNALRTIWPTFSRSKTNHRPPVAFGSRWIGSSYEKSRRRRSLRATRRMTMSRKCSYKGGNLLKQKVQFKQQILLAQPKGIQGLKRQKPIPCRPVLFHRKLKGRNQ